MTLNTWELAAGESRRDTHNEKERSAIPCSSTACVGVLRSGPFGH